MSDEHVLDALPAYAVGSLDADEVRRVEEHLTGCWACREEANSFQRVAEQLSLAAPAAVPSPDLKERLMKRLPTARPEGRVQAQGTKRPWLERLLPVWGIASLCLLIGLAGSNLLLWQRLNQMEGGRTSEGMRAVPLSAPVTGSTATGFVLISADGDDGALVVDGVPPLEKGKQYQLWLIRDGQRTSGAVFSTDENSYGGTRIRAPRSLLDYSSVEITIEPEGGSPQPTGTQVLGGPLFNP
ncbi:MAG: anti-sigma factor [Anaerolineales bacterium]